MSAQEFTSNFVTKDGVPDGGAAFGPGFSISWQRGPLVDPDGGGRKEPNGAFVETILEVVADRLQGYQKTKFACRENATAIAFIGSALAALRSRTERRTAEGIEGTAVPSPPPEPAAPASPSLSWSKGERAWYKHDHRYGGTARPPVEVELDVDLPVKAGDLARVAPVGEPPGWFESWYGGAHGGCYVPVDYLFRTREEAAG